MIAYRPLTKGHGGHSLAHHCIVDVDGNIYWGRGMGGVQSF
jgi:hypothetical protein